MKKLFTLIFALVCLSGMAQSVQWRNLNPYQFGSNLFSVTVKGRSLTNLDASNLDIGTVSPARLGSGSGGTSKFLREDSSFQLIGGASISSMFASNIFSGGPLNISGAIVSGTGFTGDAGGLTNLAVSAGPWLSNNDSRTIVFTNLGLQTSPTHPLDAAKDFGKIGRASCRERV